ncbi:MAG: DUF4840 domain-containing protein, partial [Rikenellaceae bacterium]
MKITLKRSLMAVVCVLGMTSFVACDDDDDVKIPPVTTLAVQGNYEGTMTYEIPNVPVAAADEEVTPVKVEFTVDGESVRFAKFPVEALIKAIVKDDAQTAAIIAGIGDVKYAVGYKPVLNEAKTDIEMTLDPKPLVLPQFNIGTSPMQVTVKISAAKAGNFVVLSNTYDFTLNVTAININSAEKDTPMVINLSFKA